MLIELARKATRSPALRTAAALAAGGVGFALGNLLLARVLVETEFGKVSLLLSVIQVGAALGAPGIPTLVNRYRLNATAALFRRCAAGSVAAGAAVAGLMITFGNFHFALAAVLGFAVSLAALGRVAAAFFQSRQRFGTSLVLTQVHNWLVLASVPVVLALSEPTAFAVALVVLSGYLVTTVVGWRAAAQRLTQSTPQLSRQIWLREGMSAAGFVLANNLLFQLDRLLIGGLLSIADLATYAVVAAVAGSAFRMLQVGAGYTLVPRLRTCTNRQTAVRLLRGEGLLLGGTGLVAAATVLLVMPWLIGHFLAGRYEVPQGMVVAVIGIGFIRTWEAAASATVTALGSAQELLSLNVLSWLTVAVGTACAAWGSRYGLMGVVYGLGAGWCLLAISASTLALQALSRLERS
jgi:O-antigen/teichoic acid export membrane protein